MPKPTDFEIAIVGGGPAGLSCGLWLGRYLLSTVVIDSGDPRSWPTRQVNGYLGLPGLTPASLRKRGRNECRRYGVEVVDDCVVRVRRTGIERFELKLRTGRRLISRRIVLAQGVHDGLPDIPGVEPCYGRSAHHCTDCDGYEAGGQKTVVVGYGIKAAAMAFRLYTWTADLIICTNGHSWDLRPALERKLDALGIPILESRIKRALARGSQLHGLELDDGMQLDADKLFFTVDPVAATDLAAQLGCDRDGDGLILTDHAKRTSVENVWAIGDITPGPQLAISAAADGAVAAAAVHRSLLPEAQRV